jgi:hypothetical protein
LRIVAFVIIEVAEKSMMLMSRLGAKCDQVPGIPFEIRSPANDDEMKRKHVVNIQLIGCATSGASRMYLLELPFNLRPLRTPLQIELFLDSFVGCLMFVDWHAPAVSAGVVAVSMISLRGE